MMKSFPKVLIISVAPFNRNNGTGITLSNLFEGWDKKCIAQIYMNDQTPSFDICEFYYYLKPEVAYVDHYIRKVLTPISNAQAGLPSTPAAVTLGTGRKTFINHIHLNIRAALDLSPIFLPTDMFRWISEFNPDIIYCALGNARMINITREVASKIKKPIVPHFMDDWPSTLYTQNELAGLARKLFNRRFYKLLSESNGGLCISDQMAHEYERRYHIPFSPFVNCVEDKLFCPPMKQKDGKFVVMYVGGLHLKRWQSILNISEAIAKLNNKGKNIILKVYCPANDKITYSDKFRRFPTTKFEGSLTSDQVPEVLTGAALLIHVESFEENYAKYTRFSLSTKIPQYMAAGKAILGYGPEVLASMQHISNANAGKIVSNQDIEELVEVLSELINNKELLSEYAMNGFNYAKEYHSQSHNKKQLKSVLTEFSKIG